MRPPQTGVVSPSPANRYSYRHRQRQDGRCLFRFVALAIIIIGPATTVSSFRPVALRKSRTTTSLSRGDRIHSEEYPTYAGAANRRRRRRTPLFPPRSSSSSSPLRQQRDEEEQEPAVLIHPVLIGQRKTKRRQETLPPPPSTTTSSSYPPFSSLSNKEDDTRRRKILQSLLSTYLATTSPTLQIWLMSSASASAMEDETLVTDGTGSSSSDAVAKNNGTAIKDDSVRVIKSPLDDRTYLACSLPHNDLRVLLVSDPRSLEAGAAVAVHVGATSDPSTLPGLAHFCEHMLFLGTRQYPQEDSFESFLALNGGSSNAFTDSEQTVYYMDLEIESVDRGSSNNSNKFEEALLRFGSFFTSPLFTESATGREVNAIDSENAKNLQSDTFRYFQLTKARANPLHPFSKFFTGNKRTLLPDSEPSSDRATITTSSSSSPASLSSRLREELLRFYQTYYSSNTMTLAVIGPQPVTELRSMVETAFSNVPNRHVVEPELEWNGKVPPFVDDVKGQANKGNDEKAEEESSSTHGQSQSAIIPPFGSVLEIVPVQDLRQVTLTFPIMYGNNIPMDRQTSLLIKPSSYVAQLLGHEGPKSLLSYLKSRGWANSIAAGTEEKLSDFETFEVVVGLTPNGLTALDDVILSVFSYLNMIRDRFIPSYVFEEVLRLDELQWRYQTKGPLGSYVQSLATSMQRYPPQLYVAGPRRLALDGIYHEGEGLGDDARSSFPNRHALDRTRELVRQYVSAMTVDNAMVSVLSKTFEGQTDAKEKWYGTAYRVRPIPSSTLELWRRGVSPRLLRIDFPRPNPFLPREAGLRVKHPPQDDNSSGDTASSSREAARSFESRMTPPVPPRIIRDDGRWTVHFKEDDRFGQPKGYLIFQILTQDPYSSAKRAALSNLYEVCVSDRLREYAYDAELAGLTYDVKVLPRGVRLTFGGYSDRLREFASYVTKKLSKDAVRDLMPKNDADFERYKDQVLRALSAFDVQQPYSHASYYAQLTLQPLHFQYPNAELRDATRKITLPDLVEYASTLWSGGDGGKRGRRRGEALVQGNFDVYEALDLVTAVGDALTFPSDDDDGGASREDDPPHLKALPLPPQDAKVLPTRLLVAEPNPSNENACSYVLLQCLGETPRDHVLVELLSSILGEPFYNELRTQKQLGYIVSSGVRGVGESRTLAFVVQSSAAESDELTINILAYLESALDMILKKLSAADFAVYVKSLIDRKTEPDKDLVVEVTRNWGEISSGRLQFDRPQLEASALLDLTRDDLLEFWKGLYSGNGRRVLICEVIPRGGPASSTLPPSTFGYKLMDLANESIALGVDDIEMFRRDREQMVDSYIQM